MDAKAKTVTVDAALLAELVEAAEHAAAHLLGEVPDGKPGKAAIIARAAARRVKRSVEA
jgi:hypothetical protein